MIVLKVKIYANGQILIPNCGVPDSVSALVRETEKSSYVQSVRFGFTNINPSEKPNLDPHSLVLEV